MRILGAVTVVAITLSIPAFAGDASSPATQQMGLGKYSDNQGLGSFVGEEIDVSFAASRARLRAEGYRGVKRVNGDPLYLSAFDPQGSEVLLTISSQSGEIDRTDYIHGMDE